MKLNVSNSCITCKHINQIRNTSKDVEYSYSTTFERWCFKHKQYTTIALTCDDYDKSKKAQKTIIGKVNGYNTRIDTVKDIIMLIGVNSITVDDKTFFVKNEWLFYRIGNSFVEYAINVKDDATDTYIRGILAKLSL